MKKSIACIVYKNEKIFIAHRNPGGDMGNRWEFPGGKVDRDESDYMAIEREMSEEFGVKAFPREKIASEEFSHDGKDFLLNAYLVDFEEDGVDRPFTLSEHSEYKWISLSEIPVENFVDSDLKILPKVLSYLEQKK